MSIIKTVFNKDSHHVIFSENKCINVIPDRQAKGTLPWPALFRLVGTHILPSFSEPPPCSSLHSQRQKKDRRCLLEGALAQPLKASTVAHLYSSRQWVPIHRTPEGVFLKANPHRVVPLAYIAFSVGFCTFCMLCSRTWLLLPNFLVCPFPPTAGPLTTV